MKVVFLPETSRVLYRIPWGGACKSQSASDWKREVRSRCHIDSASIEYIVCRNVSCWSTFCASEREYRCLCTNQREQNVTPVGIAVRPNDSHWSRGTLTLGSFIFLREREREYRSYARRVGNVYVSVFRSACRNYEPTIPQTEIIRQRAAQYSEPSSRRGSVGVSMKRRVAHKKSIDMQTAGDISRQIWSKCVRRKEKLKRVHIENTHLARVLCLMLENSSIMTRTIVSTEERRKAARHRSTIAHCLSSTRTISEKHQQKREDDEEGEKEKKKKKNGENDRRQRPSSHSWTRTPSRCACVKENFSPC